MSDAHNEYPTTIRLDRKDRRLLEKLAKLERLPQSEIVRRAIRRMGAERGLCQGNDNRQAVSA